MNIIIVDNAAMINTGGRCLCFENTGKFAQELSDCGNNVMFLQLARKSELTISNFDIVANSLKECHVNIKRFVLWSYIILLLKAIHKIVKADFVYFFYPNNLWFLIYLCIILKKPYGLYVRGMVGVESNRSIIFYKNADVVLTVSPTFTSTISSISKHAVVDTVRPMVDITVDDIYLRHYDAVPPVYHFTFLGRMDMAKGLNELCCAIKILVNEGIRNFQVEFWGNGSALPLVEKFINDNDLSQYAICKGPVKGKDSVLSVYRKSDCYILPTYHEGFARTLYEAMISGTPIITTLVGGIPGRMISGFNCIEIKPKDIQSIVNAMSQFMNLSMDGINNLINNGYSTVIPIIEKNVPSHANQLNSILSARK